MRVSARKRALNLIYIEKYRTAVRDAQQALATSKAEAAEKAILLAFAALDKASKARVIHKNKAANLKSQLHKALNKLAGKAVALKSSKTKVPVKKTNKK